MDLLFPPKWVFRTIFLYVWQWDSTLLIIPDWDNHRYVLIDSNIVEDDEKTFNIAEILKGKLKEWELTFINTHPHTDHLKGIKQIHESLSIWEVWHSWHIPHKDSDEEYKNMMDVIAEIWTDNEFYLKWTNESNFIHKDISEDTKIEKKLGDVDFQVFSPAQYVIDDIESETEDDRRKRIHEQCGVLKFMYEGKSIMITWDSDKASWKEYITDYYIEHLQADILHASHHGSRSFFKDGQDDEDVYVEHLVKIAPSYLVVSSPKNSKFEHPHTDAMEIYSKHIEKENIYILWQEEKNLVVDINLGGDMNLEYIDFEEVDKCQWNITNIINPPKPWKSF